MRLSKLQRCAFPDTVPAEVSRYCNLQRFSKFTFDDHADPRPNSSHANVHSQTRPHFCPVRGCPRSEGGKGFKRKNEMIRHGLVHQSPGYVCPFCPDREHKYPRPDNLQRYASCCHSNLTLAKTLPQTCASPPRRQGQRRSPTTRGPRAASRGRKPRPTKTRKLNVSSHRLS